MIFHFSTENEMNNSLLTSENSILASSFCFCGSLFHVSMFFLLLNQLCLSLLFFLDFLGNLFDLLLEVGGLLIQSRSCLQRNIESVQDLIFRLGIQSKLWLLARMKNGLYFFIFLTKIVDRN